MQIRALEWTDRFQRYLETERRVSPHTVCAYRRQIAALVAFCDGEGVDTWSAVQVSHIRNFAARSHARGLSAQSVQHVLSACRTFLKFLIREGVIGANVAELVQAPKAHRKLPEVLDPDQMGRLIEFPLDDKCAVRDRAIMELLYSSGLRLDELTRLNIRDLDMMDRLVSVLGKGNAARLVPVGSYAIRAIQHWLRIRKRIAKPTETALFVGRNGGRLGRRAVQTRIAYWARRQGIAVKVYPHLFRHAAATHLLESSRDIRAVQDFLGHASISTTQIYTSLDAQHISKVYDATHPRAHRR